MDPDDRRSGLTKRLTRAFGRGGRRVGVAVAGGAVLVVGIAMIALPGPALLVIPAGLAILAIEFHWARRLRDQVRDRTRETVRRLRDRDDDDGAGSSYGGRGEVA